MIRNTPRVAPRRRIDDLRESVVEDAIVLEDLRRGHSYRVAGLDARLWRELDGERHVDELARILGVSEEAVWRALDVLADVGLLAGRAAPPAGGAGVDRRGFLRRGLPGLAMVAAPALAVAAQVPDDGSFGAGEVAQKESGLKQSSEQASKQSEQSFKQAEQASKQSEQGTKQAEQSEKQAAEQEGKQNAQVFEQLQKQGSEVSGKAAEQQRKGLGEFSEKQSEQAAKDQAEQDNKPSEQSTKLGELRDKQGGESLRKLAEFQSKITDAESAGKSSEQLIKGGGSTTVIPEPSTFLLLGLGAAALGLRLRGDRIESKPPAPASDDDAEA